MDIRSKINGHLIPPDKSGALTKAGEWRYDTAVGAMVWRDGVAGADRTLRPVVPTCRAYSSGDNTAILTTAARVVPLDQEEWDTDGMHSTVTNTSRITVVTKGLYLIIGRAAITANNAGDTPVAVQLYKNGGTTTPGTQLIGRGMANATAVVMDQMAATDYIELRLANNTAGTVTTSATSGQSWLMLAYLGDYS